MKLKQSDKFEDITSKIFARLLETFPEPISFYAKDIGILDECPDNSVAHIDGMPILPQRKENPDKKFVNDCIEWLVNEKYLTAAQKEFDIFRRVVLTEKGLNILNATPQFLNRNHSDWQVGSGGPALLQGFGLSPRRLPPLRLDITANQAQKNLKLSRAGLRTMHHLVNNEHNPADARHTSFRFSKNT